MDPDDSLPEQQVRALLALGGVHGPVACRLLQRRNDVYRIASGDEVFFLKLHTKDWYADDVESQAYCVAHEASAFAHLAAHGLATPDVVLALTTADNPLGRPCLLTRQLAGAPLTTLLKGVPQEDPATFASLLETAGDYLRRMHAITFPFPGYIVGGGPAAPPDEDAWQHQYWTPRAAQRSARAGLEHDRSRLSPELAAQLEGLFGNMAETLALDFAPRFVHGDCHAHQFFLDHAAEPSAGWRVTGVVDMEVASAGDRGFDLVKFGLEMAAHFPAATRWWEPLFAGYGETPDFERYRLRLLASSEAEFKCHGPGRWPGTRQEIIGRLLAAPDWSALFTT